MARYKIEISEILQTICEVEAETLEDAIHKAEYLYKEGKIELTAENLMQTSFCDYDGGGLFGN